VLEREPSFVRPGAVWHVPEGDVPPELREHAERMLSSTHGPGEHWWSLGVWWPGGVRRTLVARRLMSGAMQWGTLVSEIFE
jgi:hypothetical protein